MNTRMPLLFVGHGTPMNAIEDNAFSQSWRTWGQSLPRPRAVLCVSAHWETNQARVTAMEHPRTIHDFGGFPRKLYEVLYPAPGCPWLSEAVSSCCGALPDLEWGLDHGCWSVLTHLYPQADVPVAQLSLSRSLSPRGHFALGQKLRGLRDAGVLVIGSGNLVHNLQLLEFQGEEENFGLPWALEANALFKQFISEDRHEPLMDYETLGAAVQRAVPTPEHFLPLLYVLAAKESTDTITYFNDQPWGGALTMTSLVIR